MKNLHTIVSPVVLPYPDVPILTEQDFDELMDAGYGREDNEAVSGVLHDIWYEDEQARGLWSDPQGRENRWIIDLSSVYHRPSIYIQEDARDVRAHGYSWSVDEGYVLSSRGTTVELIP